MKPRRVVPIALVCLLVTVAVAVLSLRTHLGSGRVYTVEAVQAGLARDPSDWLNRPLLVQGTVPPVPVPLGAGASSATEPAMGYLLVQSINAPAVFHLVLGMTVSRGATPGGPAQGALLLALGHEDPLLGALRRAPLVGRFAPPPQTLHFFGPATYRIELERTAVPSTGCDRSPCYRAVLLDATLPTARTLLQLITGTGRGTGGASAAQ